MLIFPDINPIAVSIGPVDIHWYGICYLVGFLLALWFLVSRGKQLSGWDMNTISDLIFYVAIGVIFGGRVGYILFYAPTEIIAAPWEVKSDSFFFAEGKLIIHNRAIYNY